MLITNRWVAVGQPNMLGYDTERKNVLCQNTEKKKRDGKKTDS